jgi:hypothetical protein
VENQVDTATATSRIETEPPNSPSFSENNTEMDEANTSTLQPSDNKDKADHSTVPSSDGTDKRDPSTPQSCDDTDSLHSTNHHRCQACQAVPKSSERKIIAELYKTIERLNRENAALKILADPEPDLPQRIQVLHRVSCDCNSGVTYGRRNARVSIFLDTPHRVLAPERRIHLQGSSYAGDVENYLRQNKEVILLVYKDYRCKVDIASFMKESHASHQSTIAKIPLDTDEASSDSESIVLVSNILRESLCWALENPQSLHQYPVARLNQEIKAPYYHFYHYRIFLRQKINGMDEDHKKQISLLMEYVEESFERSYGEANALFSQGRVSYETMQYLFEPEMYVVKKESGEMVARVANCWLEEESNRECHKEMWRLDCWSWRFDNWFWKEATPVRFDWTGSRDEIKPIQNLPVYPLRYADPKLENELRTRGRKFWSCRQQIYISYNDESFLGNSITVSYFLLRVLCNDYSLTCID